jgi:hypothetical protein
MNERALTLKEVIAIELGWQRMLARLYARCAELDPNNIPTSVVEAMRMSEFDLEAMRMSEFDLFN